MSSGSFVDKSYIGPQDLDLFAIETKSRRTISELIKPIMTDMEQDRRKTAEAYLRLERVQERLFRVEYALGLNKEKPKVFMDIDNNIAQLKADMAVQNLKFEHEVEQINNKISLVDRDLSGINSSIKSIDNLLIVREDQIRELS